MSSDVAFSRAKTRVPPLAVHVTRAGEAAFARLRSASASATPFQSAGWMQSFLAAHEALDSFRLIEIADGSGNALLLPLMLAETPLARIATRVGRAHASYFAPLSEGDPYGWDGSRLRPALAAAATLAGFEAYLLPDCRRDWQGPNPLLALPHRPAPSDGAMLTIDGSTEAVFARLFDRETRKKQRYKRRKLGEAGVLAAGWVPCDPDMPSTLDRFFAWKAAQFAAMGIADPFACPQMRAFLRDAACGETNAIRLFALRLDGRPVAIVGVATGGPDIAGRAVSGMFTAYDPDPAIARFSPGDVAMTDLVETLCEEGATGFDLGIGEARYKTHLCPEPLVVADIAFGVSARGRLAASTWLAGRGAKGMVKRNPALFALARRLRRALPFRTA